MIPISHSFRDSDNNIIVYFAHPDDTSGENTGVFPPTAPSAGCMCLLSVPGPRVPACACHALISF